jgi:hypothetical protein
MKCKMAALVVLALLPQGIACCSGVPASWETRDGHSPAGVSEVYDCRFQARRQAEARYPRGSMERYPGPGTRASRPPLYDLDRFASENQFFELCMQQKGFRRAS